MLVGKRLGRLLRNLSVFLVIALSRHQNFENILVGVRLNLPQPRRHVVECANLSGVKGQENAISSFVVRLCYGAEAFLACRVPYLQLNILTIYL